MSLISFFCYETWLVFYLTCVWMMCTLFCHESSLVFYLTCVWMMCTLFCHNILFVIHFNFLLWYLISLLFDMCMNDVLFFCHDILSFLSLISIFLLWDLISLLFDVCMNDVHNFFVIIYFLSLISIFLLRNGTWLVFYLMCVWMICTLFCHNILFACHFIFFFLLWEFISILFEVSMNGVCTVFFFHFFFCCGTWFIQRTNHLPKITQQIWFSSMEKNDDVASVYKISPGITNRVHNIDFLISVFSLLCLFCNSVNIFVDPLKIVHDARPS